MIIAARASNVLQTFKSWDFDPSSQVSNQLNRVAVGGECSSQKRDADSNVAYLADCQLPGTLKKVLG
jgi:hypothetical protein